MGALRTCTLTRAACPPQRDACQTLSDPVCVVCDPSYPPLSHPGGSFAIRSTHFEIAMAAVERGLHVMVTKPAVKTLADHIKLVEAAKAKGELSVWTALPVRQTSSLAAAAAETVGRETWARRLTRAGGCGCVRGAGAGGGAQALRPYLRRRARPHQEARRLLLHVRTHTRPSPKFSANSSFFLASKRLTTHKRRQGGGYTELRLRTSRQTAV